MNAGTRRSLPLAVFAAALTLAAQCQGGTATPVSDTTRIQQLEREARALVKADGCTLASDCRTAPVGWRACGGPREYVVYCARTTDSAALAAKLEELRRAEDDYNKKEGLVSTCEFREPPSVAAENGVCRAR